MSIVIDNASGPLWTPDKVLFSGGGSASLPSRSQFVIHRNDPNLKPETELVSLENFRAQHPGFEGKDFIGYEGEDPDIILLRDIHALADRTWKAVEARGKFTFPDTPDKILELFTSVGARIRVLYSVHEEKQEKKLVGAKLVLTDPNTFLAPIPKELLDRLTASTNGKITNPREHCGWGTRLYVSPEAGSLGVRGEALTTLVGEDLELLKEMGKRWLITRFVAAPEECAHLENRRTYIRLGLEDTDIRTTSPERMGGKERDITWGFMVFPPISYKGKIAVQQMQQFFKDKGVALRKQALETLPDFPAFGATIAYFGNHKAGYDLACAFPGNTIYNIDSCPRSKRRYEPKDNLINVETRAGFLDLPEECAETVNTIYVANATHDIYGRGEKIQNFIGRMAASLPIGDRLIIKDEVLKSKKLEQMMLDTGLNVTCSRLVDLEGETYRNCVVTAEKRKKEYGSRIEVGEVVAEKASFLEGQVWENTETGQQVEIIRRPQEAVNVCVFTEDGQVVLSQRPRPLLTLPERMPHLSNTRSSAYPLEQPAFASKGGSPEEEAFRILSDIYEVDPSKAEIVMVSQSLPDYDLAEKVTSVCLRIKGSFTTKEVQNPNPKFISPMLLHPVDARMFLEALQIGAVSDERAARVLYEYFLRYNMGVGPRLSGKLELQDQGKPKFNIVSLEEALTPRAGHNVFKQLEGKVLEYFDIRTRYFREVDGYGNSRRIRQEYFTPSGKIPIIHDGFEFEPSNNAYVLIPVIGANGEYYVGLKRRDVPAVQLHSKQIFDFDTSEQSSFIEYTAPKNAKRPVLAEDNILKRVASTEGVTIEAMGNLGLPFLNSQGASLKSTVPVFAELRNKGDNTFLWVPAREMIQSFMDPELEPLSRFLVNGPSRTAFFRFCHAVGYI